MFRQIAEEVLVAWNRDADGSRDQAVRLPRRRLGHDDEGDLAGLEALDTLRARQDPAAGWKDARYAHEVARGDTGGAQRELEGGQLFAVLADTLREKHLFGDESDHVTLLMPLGISMVNTPIPTVKET